MNGIPTKKKNKVFILNILLIINKGSKEVLKDKPRTYPPYSVKEQPVSTENGEGPQ